MTTFETTCDAILDRAAAALLLLGRLLLAWIFLHESVWLVFNFVAASGAMAKMGVPWPLLVATMALQFTAGAAIALGFGCRIGALALAFFCVATAVLFHGHTEIRAEMLHFQKDLAIAGGLLVLAATGPGRWTLAQALALLAAAPARGTE